MKIEMAISVARKIVFVLGVASFLVSYSAADVAVFGYGKGSDDGPDQWGTLRPEWKTCSSGSQQSPIDIVRDDAKHDPSLDMLKRDYSDAKATLINNGFHVELLYEEGVGNVFVDGKSFSLQQLHWHSPSEHTIDGERFPVELHLVHKSKDGQIAVVAILYQYGHADTFIDQLTDSLKDLDKEQCAANEEVHVPAGVVQNKALKRSTRKYYRYVGSLTAPPCIENVLWTVMGKVREMKPEQAAALTAPLPESLRNNSRPTQPLNGRIVKLYDETKMGYNY